MNIDQFIKQKKMTSRQLANEIGVTVHSINKWRIEDCSPGLINAIKIYRYSRKKVKMEDMLTPEDDGKLNKWSKKHVRSKNNKRS